MNKSISILGCGWLGLPLGKHFSDKGYTVKGSTTNEEKLSILTKNGIESFRIQLNPQVVGENVDNFLNTETLLINIPPRTSLQKVDAHVEQISEFLQLVKMYSTKNIIYVSSTSVYPELNREIFEEDVTTPEQSASPTMVKAENLLKEFCTFHEINLTILRCGGLMGYERIPAKYFSGWKGLTTGQIQVNYIHRDDVIGIVETIIEQNIWNETFNIVSPIHPTRKEIYAKNCEELGFEMPEFVLPSELQPFKIISPKKWIDYSKYSFIYENPLDYFYKRIV
ncbi:Protein YeeZ [Emticicia aquatica]|uniref:Protein YeeZ n=1 Tax=Emticicia aquatica TaxID=1681835 RepID=A0ABM9ASZ5_9BACT|nr:SDR family NAD(P)-dependent oxidoreductase [Emticicia aquatica]CAH0997121.1 Protein YeeZ [Emticicia aquatica]